METCEVFNSFDALAAVTEDAHSLGMEVVPWITMSDEGIPEESYTLFAGKHPQYLVRDREGKHYDRALSYAHPEVRQYRISLVGELEEYGVDGVFLDFTRWVWKGHVKARGVSLVDEKGVCLFGYDEPVVEAYKCSAGKDPCSIPNGGMDWVRFRAEADQHGSATGASGGDAATSHIRVLPPAEGFFRRCCLMSRLGLSST